MRAARATGVSATARRGVELATIAVDPFGRIRTNTNNNNNDVENILNAFIAN